MIRVPSSLDVVPLAALQEIAALAPTPASSTSASSAPTDTSREARVHHARVYIAAIPPAIAGHGGDAATFRLCCALTRGFDLAEDEEVFEILTPWNARCEPPWSEKDLLTKIRNARQYGDEPIGGRLRDFPFTETGDAECFVATNGDRTRYDHAQGRWLLTSADGIWLPDPVEQLRRLTVAVMRDRQRRALAIADTDQRKRVLKWCLDGESTRRISTRCAKSGFAPSRMMG